MEENRKSSSVSFWCCIGVLLLTVYVAAYVVLRGQDVLVEDVKIYGGLYFQGLDGRWYSELGVTANPYVDDIGPWQRLLGPPATIAFWPLCELEDAVRNKLRYGHFFR